jgi:hypothetical protein
LEHVAADEDFQRAFHEAVKEGADTSARRDLQRLLEKLDREIALADSGSWYVLDAEGTQVARSPQALETIGSNYAYRDYFHGQGMDLDRDSRPKPLTRPHLSIVFTSEATNQRTVALAVPIFDDAGGDPIGVLCHSVELGHFAELRDDERTGNDQIPVLVDCRKDETGRRGAILEHPGLRAMLKKGPEVADRLYLPDGTLKDLDVLRRLRREPHPDNETETAQTSELATLDDYHDPLGDEFAGRWLAAAEAVEVIARHDLTSRDTGWVVLVQERAEAAVAPVQRLRDQLLWRAKLATTFFAIVLAGLWGFVVLVLNESPRLRWLSRLRHHAPRKSDARTPDSTGFGSVALSPSTATAAPPPSDTLPRREARSARQGEGERVPGGD